MATIVFFPEGAFGPTNNCVGIGHVLRERGHRVVFMVEESFAGTLEAHGFEERLMRLGPPAEEAEEPGQFWMDFIRDTAPVFRKPTIEQLEEFIAPTFQALCDGARYVDERLREIFDELQPDVIVEDNVVSLPRARGQRPAAGCASSRATRSSSPIRPAARLLGLPEADRSAWDGVRGRVPAHARRPARRRSTRSAASAARRRCRELEFMHDVALAEPLRLPRRGRLPRARGRSTPTWHRLETCVRATRRACELPDAAARAAAARCVYLSLGCLGSADVGADAAPGRHPRRARRTA